MPSYRIALGSTLIIESGTAASPYFSGLSFSVSGLTYPTLGGAVNASATPITNVWSGVAFCDNREQTFYGQNIFTQPVVIGQAVSSTQAATLGQVVSYNNLSGTGGSPNVSSELSGVQSLAISTQNSISILEPEVITLQNNFSGLPATNLAPLENNQSGIASTLLIVQNKTTTLGSNQSGLTNTIGVVQSESNTSQSNISVLDSNFSGLQITTTTTQARTTVLTTNFSGLSNTIVAVQEDRPLPQWTYIPDGGLTPSAGTFTANSSVTGETSSIRFADQDLSGTDNWAALLSDVTQGGSFNAILVMTDLAGVTNLFSFTGSSFGTYFLSNVSSLVPTGPGNAWNGIYSVSFLPFQATLSVLFAQVGLTPIADGTYAINNLGGGGSNTYQSGILIAHTEDVTTLSLLFSQDSINPIADGTYPISGTLGGSNTYMSGILIANTEAS